MDATAALRALLSRALDVLDCYGNPEGYRDGDGHIPDPDEGTLARVTAAEIRAELARLTEETKEGR